VTGLLDPLRAVDPLLALSVGGGVATFFAPCAYPLLPGYVAYFLADGDDGQTPLARRLRRALVVSAAVVAGFLVVFAVLAAVVAAVGTGPLRNVSVLELVVGVGLVVLGLGMATGRLQPATHVQLPERRRSVSGFVAFGVVYAVAAAGCTAPLFVGLAGVALAGGPATAVRVFGGYVAGMAGLMVAVTVLAALGRGALLRRLSGATGRLSRVAGVAVALAGVAQVYLFLFEFGGLELLGLA
jgi:cytochrome c-type biogenesis protein